MSNNFNIANRRRYQERLVSRDFWVTNEHRLFTEDVKAGFTGNFESWKTEANFTRIRKIVGSCAFTKKMMVARGWPEGMFL